MYYVCGVKYQDDENYFEPCNCCGARINYTGNNGIRFSFSPIEISNETETKRTVSVFIDGRFLVMEFLK